jgi:Kef-type K+ transport system membrane component KefB
MDTIPAIIAILVLAKVLGELLERIGYPPMIGEIGAGIILGPEILGWVTFDQTLEVFSTIGVIVLLFISGVEMNARAFAAARNAAATTAAAGVAVPFVAGFAGGYLLGFSFIEQLFLATVLSITSIGVSVRTLIDLRRLNTLVGNTIVGAAVVDDIIGIVLLGILSSIALTGRVEVGALAVTILLSLLFIAFAFTAGKRLITGAFARSRLMLTHEMPYAVAIIIALAMAAAAHALALHYAIGAFIAGLLLGPQIRDDRSLFNGILDFGFGFFVTFFFASIGLLLALEPGTIVSPLVFPLVILAVGGKTIGGYLGSIYYLRDHLRALTVGFGLSARGEIALVVAQTSLAAGFITQGLYSAVAVTVVTTVFAAPLLMRWGFAKTADRSSPPTDGLPQAETR